MIWIVFPYSESYFEETKYILVKFYQFSCNQDYYYTNSIRKRAWIVFNFSAFVICLRSCRISVLCAHFLWKFYANNDDVSDNANYDDNDDDDRQRGQILIRKASAHLSLQLR